MKSSKFRAKKISSSVLIMSILFLVVLAALLFFHAIHKDNKKEIAILEKQYSKLSFDSTKLSEKFTSLDSKNKSIHESFNKVLLEMEGLNSQRKSTEQAINQTFISNFSNDAYLSILTDYGIVEKTYTENSNDNDGRLKPSVSIENSLILSSEYKASVGIVYNDLHFSVENNIINVNFDSGIFSVLGVEFTNKAIIQETSMGTQVPIEEDRLFYANHAISLEKELLESAKIDVLSNNREFAVKRLENIIISLAKKFGLKYITVNEITYRLIEEG